MATVWLVDDDPSMLWVLERALGQAGFTTVALACAEAALERWPQQRPDAVVADIRMPGMDGLELAAWLHARAPQLPVIVMTAHSDLDTTVAAFDEGAFEYLAKPFDLDDAVATVRRACRPALDADAPGGAGAAPAGGDLIGRAPAMQTLFRAIGRLARTPVTTLITGESGSGKELVAQALHRHSPRAGGPFVALNMAAIPRELLEAELFGHERGAFTGAEQRRPGRFEQAAGGSLFLDEIGDMPAALQTRLLRVLSEGVYHRLGGQTPLHADVRVIAATHQDLAAAVERGEFRADLYHRLNVVHLPVPPLRERRADIPLLAGHFLGRCAEEAGTAPKRLSRAAAERLSGLDWPGNVRELENVCRWLTVMAAGRDIGLEELPAELAAAADGEAGHAPGWTRELRTWADGALAAGRTGIAEDARRAVESELIRAALARSGGRRSDAARLLGWGRNTITRKIRELGLDQGVDR